MNAAAKAGPSVVQKTTQGLKNTTDAVVNKVKNLEQSTVWWIAITIVILFVGFYVIPYLIMEPRTTVSNADNVKTTLEERIAILETKFAGELKDKKSLAQAASEQDVSAEENCLINFQPLTVIHPGFLGPLKNGVYDPEPTAVSMTLRMGVRCFVLPVDYHDKDTMAKPFPEANKPCLMFRDEGDTVRSINAGSIATVAQTIADTAWSDVVMQKNDPFILILEFVRTPEVGTKKYLDFLSKVARDLSPLSPYLLGQTPEGKYNRQERQDQLLFVDIAQLEKKLIVMCNVDTSGFRTSKRDFDHQYLPKEDLDYWTTMRIYKQNADTKVGSTSMPEKNVVPRAILDRTTYYTMLPTDASTKRTAIDGTKEKFMITLSQQGMNPEIPVLDTLLDTYGVQCVPLTLIDYTPDVKTILAKWKYAWRAKPKAIRYVRPPAIQVTRQSAVVDANQGIVRSPT